MDFESLINIVTGLLVPVVMALVGWAGKLQKSITDLRVMMAEQYVQRSALDSVHEDLEWLKRTLYQMAAKLGVQTDRL